jgi:arylformamidase
LSEDKIQLEGDGVQRQAGTVGDLFMIYDVSVPITNTMPVWPTDPPVRLLQQSHESRDKSHTVTVTTITMGSHTGTHFDAPFHMIQGGKRLHEFSLDVLVGRATVFEIAGVRSIGRAQLERLTWNQVARVLFKTDNSRHWQDGKFYEDFVYLEPDGAAFLVERGVQLVGIDYLSIDKFKSEAHPTHFVLLNKDVLILEGLNLNTVTAGEYTLYALPLNLQDADGAPARVILMN